jgi:hypothetical protein
MVARGGGLYVNAEHRQRSERNGAIRDRRRQAALEHRAPERADRGQRVADSYLAGRTLEECAAIENVSIRTIARDLEKGGIARRHRDPAPGERQCAREGCSNLFRPTRQQLDLGYGRFCSRECDHAAHRLYPQPDERECARAGCERRFRPTTYSVAQGEGRYCSRSCSALAQPKHRDEGEWVACDLWKAASRGKRTAGSIDPHVLSRCRKHVWRWRCELDRDRGEKEGWFCSRDCHAEHRKLFPWPGIRAFISPAASGAARQRMLGAREGRLHAPKGANRPQYTDEQANQVRELRRTLPGRKGSIRAIARMTGLSKYQVETILSAPKVSGTPF